MEDKILDITNSATTTAFNAKISEVKSKISNITNLATTTVLTAVENKIPNVSNFIEIENKTNNDHDHDQFITTQEFNKLTAENLTARLAETNLVSKNDIANFVKKTDLNKNGLNEL